jgi:hypothetical protein
MKCKDCNTKHPEDQIANPHYCITRLEEALDKTDVLLAITEKEIKRLAEENILLMADWMTEYVKVKDLKTNMVKLIELIDGAMEIVETYGCSSPAQIQWKKQWLEKANAVLKCEKPLSAMLNFVENLEKRSLQRAIAKRGGEVRKGDDSISGYRRHS